MYIVKSKTFYESHSKLDNNPERLSCRFDRYINIGNSTTLESDDRQQRQGYLSHVGRGADTELGLLFVLGDVRVDNVKASFGHGATAV